MYISNDEILNNPFCRLQFMVKTFGQVNEPTNQNSIKVVKLNKS